MRATDDTSEAVVPLQASADSLASRDGRSDPLATGLDAMATAVTAHYSNQGDGGGQAAEDTAPRSGGNSPDHRVTVDDADGTMHEASVVGTGATPIVRQEAPSLGEAPGSGGLMDDAAGGMVSAPPPTAPGSATGEEAAVANADDDDLLRPVKRRRRIRQTLDEGDIEVVNEAVGKTAIKKRTVLRKLNERPNEDNLHVGETPTAVIDSATDVPQTEPEAASAAGADGAPRRARAILRESGTLGDGERTRLCMRLNRSAAAR